MATAATAPPPPARRAQNAEATRQALIRVGARLFAASGYAKVSIDEICGGARVTKGALYHHFDDKRDLFRSVYEDIERRWVDGIVEAVADETDPLRRLHRGCAAFLDTCLDPAIQRIVLLDGPSVLGLEELRAVDNARGFELIAEALENAVAARQLERQPVGPLAHLFLGAMNEASFAIARAKDPVAARAEMGEALASLIDGLQPRGAALSVGFEIDGPVAIVTLDRAEVANAIDRPTAEELVAAFRRFDEDPSLAVAVLTGANDTFCAGADLKAMRSGDGERITRVAPDGDGPVGPTRMLLSKPVIAAVEGHAVAGGLEVAIWCDMRVAAEDAVFGVYCRRWGIPLMDGGTIRLPRLIGQSRALDMILTGRGVSGEEALQFGLANRLVPNGDALAAAIALAHEIAERPQRALQSDRRSAYEQWALDLDAALLNEYELGMKTLETGEMFGGLDDYASGNWKATPDAAR